jgi:hypothetical protein
VVKEGFDALGLARGTLIQLTWHDITEDSVGDPTKASMMTRHTYTLFWEQKVDKGLDCIVTTYTLDKESPAQQGWCITPLAVVDSIKVIRRPGGRRKKKE